MGGVPPLASLTFPVSVVNTDGGSEKKKEWHAGHELAMHEVANVHIAEKREKEEVADRKKKHGACCPSGGSSKEWKWDEKS